MIEEDKSLLEQIATITRACDLINSIENPVKEFGVAISTTAILKQFLLTSFAPLVTPANELVYLTTNEIDCKDKGWKC